MKKLVLALSSVAVMAANNQLQASEGTLCSQYFHQENWANAYKHCLRAASDGELDAQKKIATLFHTGRSGHRNLREALRWYLAAAKQGDVNSQALVGMFYYTGVGVPQSYLQAHLWLNIAASNGSSFGAETRRDLESLMSSEQIAEAQNLAQQCLGSDYRDC